MPPASRTWPGGSEGQNVGQVGVGAREHHTSYLRTAAVSAHVWCEWGKARTCEPRRPAWEQHVLPENRACGARLMRIEDGVRCGGLHPGLRGPTPRLSKERMFLPRRSWKVCLFPPRLDGACFEQALRPYREHPLALVQLTAYPWWRLGVQEITTFAACMRIPPWLTRSRRVAAQQDAPPWLKMQTPMERHDGSHGVFAHPLDACSAWHRTCPHVRDQRLHPWVLWGRKRAGAAITALRWDMRKAMQTLARATRPRPPSAACHGAAVSGVHEDEE